MQSSNPITVNGVRLDDYAFNIETKEGWGATPGLRGNRSMVPGRSGSIPRLNGRREDGRLALRMWVSSDVSPTGQVPAYVPKGQRYQNWLLNRDRLLALFDSTYSLLDVRQSFPNGAVRQALCEFKDSLAPKFQGDYGMVTVGLEIPGAFWRDVATQTFETAVTGNQGVAFLAGMTAPLESAVLQIVGPATNPRFTDPRTGHYVELQRALTAAETWTLDVAAGTSMVGATSVVAQTVAVGAHLPRLFALAPPQVYGGSPILGVLWTGGSAATRARLTGRRHFL